jgi:hypothetical protein
VKPDVQLLKPACAFPLLRTWRKPKVVGKNRSKQISYFPGRQSSRRFEYCVTDLAYFSPPTLQNVKISNRLLTNHYKYNNSCSLKMKPQSIELQAAAHCIGMTVNRASRHKSWSFYNGAIPRAILPPTTPPAGYATAHSSSRNPASGARYPGTRSPAGRPSSAQAARSAPPGGQAGTRPQGARRAYAVRAPLCQGATLLTAAPPPSKTLKGTQTLDTPSHCVTSVWMKHRVSFAVREEFSEVDGLRVQGRDSWLRSCRC